MTLIPSDSWAVRGVEGDTYKVGPYCDAPGCKRPVDHKHHMWRRSFLGGDFWWVQVPVGEVKGSAEEPKGEWTLIRNVIGLCWQHHEDVTGSGKGHRAWIRYLEDEQALYWLENDGFDRWIAIGTLSLPAPPEAAPAPTAPGREAERCPTCGHRIKKDEPHEHEPGPKRARKSWTVKVPADSEDGAAVLDELVESCAEIFEMDDYRSALARYHVLVRALYLVIQNRDLLEVA